MNILVLNAGSSSLKFGVFEASFDPTPLVTGQVERIGSANPVVRFKEPGDNAITLDQSGHANCLAHVVSALRARGVEIDGAAHRVVHGGERFSEPVVVSSAILDELDALVRLAPLHQPHNLAGIRAIEATLPGLPQVACFDTAFHASQPLSSRMLPLPRKCFEEGVRRYGFHGLSYEYVSRAEILHGFARVVVAHLGSGSSACAIHNGRSVGSSMGFTAIDGLIMGTRTGSLDPGVILHLIREGRTAQEVENMLYKESGLLGLSGFSSDVRDLESARLKGHPGAALALSMYCDSAADKIAGLANSMRGMDALVFTAGVGEHSAFVREEICKRLAWTGVRLDAEANSRSAERSRDLGAADAPIRVFVVPTNEEKMMALHAFNHLGVHMHGKLRYA